MKTPYLDEEIRLVQEAVLASPTLDKRAFLFLLKIYKCIVSLLEDDETLPEKAKSTLCDEIRAEIEEKLQLLPSTDLIQIRRMVVKAVQRQEEVTP